MNFFPFITTFVRCYFFFPCSVSFLSNIVLMILVLSSQHFSVRRYIRRFISLPFSTFFCTPFAQYRSCLPKVFKVLVHSCDEPTLPSFSLHVRTSVRYWPCLLNIFPYVTLGARGFSCAFSGCSLCSLLWPAASRWLKANAAQPPADFARC